MRAGQILKSGAALLLMLMPWLPTTAEIGPADDIGSTEPVYFLEPGSGRKVGRYWVELPFRDDKPRSFRIPCECPHVLAELEFSEAARDTVMHRSMWQKVAADCRYMRYLKRHGTASVTDHVSSFDFYNAPLERFPLNPDCLRTIGAPTGDCNPLETDRRGMLRYFPLGRAANVAKNPGGRKACMLRDGVFSGVLQIAPGGVLCFDTGEVQGVRLIGVDFADVDGDRVLDAVLRLTTLGPASGRQRLRLPLTRSSADADFTTVPAIVDESNLP